MTFGETEMQETGSEKKEKKKKKRRKKEKRKKGDTCVNRTTSYITNVFCI
jgi:hypothetical protein